MQRLMIFGLPGSGKSTLAVKLAAGLKLPLHHLDRHFYVENWVERSTAEFLAIQAQLVAQLAWIIDGNARRSLEMRYSRADTALYLRFNRLICLWRLLKRSVRPDTAIEDLPPGCTKSVRWRLISYMWRFHHNIESQLSQLKARYPQVRLVELRNTRQVRQLLRELGC